MKISSTIVRVLSVFVAGLAISCPAQTFSLLHGFGDAGDSPQSALVLSGGVLYGAAYSGGPAYSGTIFKVNPDGSGFTVLHTFTETSGPLNSNDDGSSPLGRLVVSGNMIYGVTSAGGSAGDGTVFALHTNGGGFTNLHTFTGDDGSQPGAGLLLSRGILYGTGYTGGDNASGVIFSVNTDGSDFNTLYSFSAGLDGDFNDGGNPQTELVMVGNTLYGTTTAGGTNSTGSIFAVGDDGSGFTNIYEFTAPQDDGLGDSLSVNSDGIMPDAGLIASGNTLYGTTSTGGHSGNGTVFKLQTTGVGFKVLGTFPGADTNEFNTIGFAPQAQLFLSAGVLYGTTPSGGAAGDGTVFQITTNGGFFKALHSFSATDQSGVNADGANPNAGVFVADNVIYGAAQSGGSDGVGTLFKLSTDGSGFGALLEMGGLDGAPYAGLTLAGGVLYGTTSDYGASGSGAVFKINPNGGGYRALHEFANFSVPLVNSDGSAPTAPVTVGGDLLYGCASAGGVNGSGTIFALNTNGGGFRLLHSFATSVPITNVVNIAVNNAITNVVQTNFDGAGPDGSLALAGGVLYGTASSGGVGGGGTVFSIGANGSAFTLLHTFSMVDSNGLNDDGAAPQDGMILSGSTLFGVTPNAGPNGLGTIFAVNTDGSDFRTLYTFPGADTNGLNTDGSSPYGRLVLVNKTLYGVTYDGANGNGTIFSIHTDGSDYTVLHAFSAMDTSGINTDGAAPQAGLTLVGDTLFGATDFGGSGGNGTVFSINLDGSEFTPLYSFTAYDDSGGNNDGANPYGSLTLVGQALYGTTSASGFAGNGTIFDIRLPSTPLHITSQPMSQSIRLTGAAAFNVGVAGSPPVFYHWRKNGANLADNARLTGSSTTSLAIAGLTIADTGLYSVLASNFAGFVVSSNVWLTVVTNPVLSITAPALNQRASNSVFVAHGTCHDQVAVTGVYYSLNGGEWSRAALANHATNWTANLSLSPGANMLSAFCIDSAGNFSLTNSVGFVFVTSATLSVTTNGHGVVSPIDNKKLLAIGANYTLTATASPGWWFSNWIGGTALPYAVLSSSPAYTFSMQSNLALVANFVPNPYLAAQGGYNGLFALNGAPREQTNSGYFSFTLTTNGTASGKIILGAATNLWTAKFAVDGTATARFLRAGKTNTLTLALDFADQSLSGSLTDGSFTAQVLGDRAIFGAIHKATAFAGRYTMVIPGSDDPTIAPFGTSYGVVVIDSLGNITFSGSLADGTPASQTTVVSKDGYWPMYVSLYGGKGSLWSWNVVANKSISANPGASWINATNSAKTAALRSGFTNQAAAVVGAWYSATNNPLFGFTNGVASFQGGDLPGQIINGFSVSAKNKITVTTPNTNKIVLTINPTNGVVSGSFANPLHPSQTNKFNGVLLQNSAHAAGYFPGASNSGAFILVPKH